MTIVFGFNYESFSFRHSAIVITKYNFKAVFRISGLFRRNTCLIKNQYKVFRLRRSLGKNLGRARTKSLWILPSKEEISFKTFLFDYCNKKIQSKCNTVIIDINQSYHWKSVFSLFSNNYLFSLSLELSIKCFI